MRKTEIICRIIFLFLRSFPIRRKGTKGTTKGKEACDPPPSPWNPNSFKRFVCANIQVKPPSAIRLPHASVGLVFKIPFSANIAYFRASFRKTPRKCEAWASIFVEMFALHIPLFLKNASRLLRAFFGVPYHTSHGLSFCFLWLVSFLFLSRKKKRKKLTKKLFYIMYL